ncbi:MAG: hypothetical protein U5K69_12400 [Balneolaceae bacterium]|nr:hypothetical protein [Balneolaceae bacterium]
MFIKESTDTEGDCEPQRMVFYDITATSFTWDWESSKNDEATWQLIWSIWYTRAQPYAAHRF